VKFRPDPTNPNRRSSGTTTPRIIATYPSRAEAPTLLDGEKSSCASPVPLSTRKALAQLGIAPHPTTTRQIGPTSATPLTQNVPAGSRMFASNQR
jgi:hypothetical protein